MRNRRLIAATFVFVAIILTSSTQMVEATLVWSDNFNDLDNVDWFLWGVDTTDGTLRWNKSTTYGFGVHNSSVKVGTWKFDLIEHEVSETDNRTRIRFISSVNRENLQPFDYYYLELLRVATDTGHKPRYTLYKQNVTAEGVLASFDGPESGLTTHHIRISRESVRGQIRVYVNETLRIEAFGDIPANDPDRPDPVFHIALAVDVAVDNIEVTNVPEPFTPTTTTTTTTTATPTTPTTPAPPGPIPWEYLVISGVAVLAIVAIVIFAMRRR